MVEGHLVCVRGRTRARVRTRVRGGSRDRVGLGLGVEAHCVYEACEREH